MKLGIVMIHQELNLVDELSVADNIFLGREFTRFGFVDRQPRRSLNREDSSTGSVTNSIPPGLSAHSPSPTSRWWKSRRRFPTTPASSSWTSRRRRSRSANPARFSDLVDQLRKTGVTIVFISHILPRCCVSAIASRSFEMASS